MLSNQSGFQWYVSGFISYESEKSLRLGNSQLGSSLGSNKCRDLWFQKQKLYLGLYLKNFSVLMGMWIWFISIYMFFWFYAYFQNHEFQQGILFYQVSTFFSPYVFTFFFFFSFVLCWSLEFFEFSDIFRRFYPFTYQLF